MKFILGVFGVILVTILAIVLITRGDGNKGSTNKPVVVSEQARAGVSAVFTTQGEVVGQDLRRAIRIVVNQDERRLEILTGYEEAVERSHTFPNTSAAFQTFLVALDQAGFDNKQVSIVKDERGACPLGKRYIYELKEHSQSMLSLWDTTCGKKLGTFAGSKTTVRKLFEQQIPEYQKQIKGVDLTGTKVPKEES